MLSFSPSVPRLTDGKEGRAWIPEQGSRMTEGRTTPSQWVLKII